MTRRSETLEVAKEYGFDHLGEVSEKLDLNRRQLSVIRNDRPSLFHHAMAGLSLASGQSKQKVTETLNKQLKEPKEGNNE